MAVNGDGQDDVDGEEETLGDGPNRIKESRATTWKVEESDGRNSIDLSGMNESVAVSIKIWIEASD